MSGKEKKKNEKKGEEFSEGETTLQYDVSAILVQEDTNDKIDAIRLEMSSQLKKVMEGNSEAIEKVDRLRRQMKAFMAIMESSKFQGVKSKKKEKEGESESERSYSSEKNRRMIKIDDLPKIQLRQGLTSKVILEFWLKFEISMTHNDIPMDQRAKYLVKAVEGPAKIELEDLRSSSKSLKEIWGRIWESAMGLSWRSTLELELLVMKQGEKEALLDFVLRLKTLLRFLEKDLDSSGVKIVLKNAVRKEYDGI
jgi:hypothetical protein